MKHFLIWSFERDRICRRLQFTARTSLSRTAICKEQWTLSKWGNSGFKPVSLKLFSRLVQFLGRCRAFWPLISSQRAQPEKGCRFFFFAKLLRCEIERGNGNWLEQEWVIGFPFNAVQGQSPKWLQHRISEFLDFEADSVEVELWTWHQSLDSDD